MGNISTAVPGGTVDLPTGALMVQLPLLALPGRIHHQVGLFFKSQDGSFGPAGRGTSLSTSVFMQPPPNNAPGLDLALPGHRCFHFDYNFTDSAYEDSRDPELLGAKFVQGAQVLSGTLTFKNGDQWLFGTYGDLSQMQDRYGNFLQVSPGTGFTQGINYGGTYYPRADFSYSGGLVNQIAFSYALSNSNPPARAWSVTYDGSSRISSIADPTGGAWHYTWTTYTRADGQVLPLISTITSPRGYVVLTALYDSSGRITQYTAADQGVTKFAYSAALGSDGTTSAPMRWVTPRSGATPGRRRP
jgi:YD repeat-containing protein